MNDGKILCDRAPEFVLRGRLPSIRNRFTTYSGKGYRVLVFAQYEGTLDRETADRAGTSRFVL